MMPDSAARDRERRAQHMLRRVVGASADVIYVYHVPWRRIAFLGQRVREVLGFAAAGTNRLRLTSFEQLVHPADLAGFRSHLAAVVQAREGYILSQELRVKGTDGCYRWLRIRDTVLARAATGAVAKVVGVVTNIDESKRAHTDIESLPSTRDRLGDILATIGDCYLALDRHCRIVDVNPKAEAWLRMPRDKILGRSYLEVVAPGADHADAVREAVRRGVPHSIEIMSERRPGAWLDLHIHPTRDGGASVLFRDISERKQAEREAERSRRLLQSSLDALSTPIAILDRSGTIVAANAAWRSQPSPHALAGVDVGSNFLAFCAAEQRTEALDGLCKGIQSVLGGEQTTVRSVCDVECDGQRRWFQITAARFEWDGDTRLIVTNEDVTDARQAKQALSELTGRISSLREEERQRIAQELHDSTAQHLVAATLNLMTLKARSVSYPGVHKLLENVEASLEEATRELRVFTYLLHPLALENDGLERTMRAYLDGFARRTRLKAQLSVHGKVDALPFALQCSLLRIIQEALANVHRHACASHVAISLRMMPGGLKLVVSDDGRGIRGPSGEAEPGTAQTGVGIPGMRSRLREFGGTLEIHTGSRGTTLSAYVPLDMATHWSRALERAPSIGPLLVSRSHQS